MYQVFMDVCLINYHIQLELVDYRNASKLYRSYIFTTIVTTLVYDTNIFTAISYYNYITLSVKTS